MRFWCFQNKEKKNQTKDVFVFCLWNTEQTNCLLISEVYLFIDWDRQMSRGQLDDRWKEIRGKVALIFHLLITTEALPPLWCHSHTSCAPPVLSWRVFHFKQQKIPNSTAHFLLPLNPNPVPFLFLSPQHTHAVLLPSSSATSQQSREQSLGGSARLNWHCNPLGFHLLVLSRREGEGEKAGGVGGGGKGQKDGERKRWGKI